MYTFYVQMAAVQVLESSSFSFICAQMIIEIHRDRNIIDEPRHSKPLILCTAHILYFGNIFICRNVKLAYVLVYKQ